MPQQSSASVRVFYPKYNTAQVVSQLREKLPELARRLPLKRVVLFGSYAKGNYTVSSDIDLLVVYRGERQEGDYATVMQVLGLPRLEPHLYTEEEYQQTQAVQRMVKDGIVLFES